MVGACASSPRRYGYERFLSVGTADSKIYSLSTLYEAGPNAPTEDSPAVPLARTPVCGRLFFRRHDDDGGACQKRTFQSNLEGLRTTVHNSAKKKLGRKTIPNMNIPPPPRITSGRLRTIWGFFLLAHHDHEDSSSLLTAAKNAAHVCQATSSAAESNSAKGSLARTESVHRASGLNGRLPRWPFFTRIRRYATERSFM